VDPGKELLPVQYRGSCMIFLLLITQEVSDGFVGNALRIGISLHWQETASCGFRGCKNRPAPLPGRMSYKVTKPGLVLFYILAYFNCIVAY